MRLNIFKKAKYLLDTKQIKITHQNDYSIFFIVGNYSVIAKYHNHKLLWLCNCQAGSNNTICAHKIAAQDYLIHAQLSEVETQTEIEMPGFGGSTPPISIGLDHLTERQKLVLREMVCFTCETCKKKEDEVGVGKLEAHRKKRRVDGGKYIPSNIMMNCTTCHDMYDY